LGPSFHKQSENKARLVEDYAERKDARGKVRVPLRISVRKLSFHLRPQHAKETTWSQSTEYKGIPKDRWAGIRQDGKITKEDLDCNEIPKQSVDYQPLGSTSIETSEVWCEKSHVTFYGGFLPGRKIYSVTHKDVTNAEDREGGPSGVTEVFPPIQPGPSSELHGVMKQHGEQVTEIFRLPPVSEALSRTHRKKLQSGDLSKELVILPLLVQLEGVPQTKARRPRGTAMVLGGKKAHG
ncbi:50S ribosomal protein L11, partial [Varanus komodoensis]